MKRHGSLCSKDSTRTATTTTMMMIVLMEKPILGANHFPPFLFPFQQDPASQNAATGPLTGSNLLGIILVRVELLTLFSKRLVLGIRMRSHTVLWFGICNILRLRYRKFGKAKTARVSIQHKGRKGRETSLLPLSQVSHTGFSDRSPFRAQWRMLCLDVPAFEGKACPSPNLRSWHKVDLVPCIW